MFDAWSDEQFAAWLGGFFDGEGCVYLPKDPPFGVAVSLANTNRDVILGICSRLQCGVLTEIHFNVEKWKTKYDWRIRNSTDAEFVLTMIRPYLIIKADKADAALERIRNSAWRSFKRRDAEIIALAKEGFTYPELASRYNISYRRIAAICQGVITPGHSGYALPEIRQAREAKAVKHRNTPDNLTTESTVTGGFPRRRARPQHTPHSQSPDTPETSFPEANTSPEAP